MMSHLILSLPDNPHVHNKFVIVHLIEKFAISIHVIWRRPVLPARKKKRRIRRKNLIPKISCYLAAPKKVSYRLLMLLKWAQNPHRDSFFQKIGFCKENMILQQPPSKKINFTWKIEILDLGLDIRSCRTHR